MLAKMYSDEQWCSKQVEGDCSFENVAKNYHWDDDTFLFNGYTEGYLFGLVCASFEGGGL